MDRVNTRLELMTSSGSPNNETAKMIMDRKIRKEKYKRVKKFNALKVDSKNLEKRYKKK